MSDAQTVVVPREPTPDMCIAGGIAMCDARSAAETAVDEAAACYRAMIAATEKGDGVAAMTPGQLLHELRGRFFNGGGWIDYPEWADYDETGHAEWERSAMIAATPQAVSPPEDQGSSLRDTHRNAADGGSSNEGVE